MMLMVLKQKLKTWPQLLMLSLLISFAPTTPVLASGDATFSLSPSSGGYTVGSAFSVVVYETSSAADNTEGAQINLSYNASLLQYTGITSGAFSICSPPSGGGGAVSEACAATSTLSGTQAVATISFKTLASGTASVSMIAGSGTPTDIQNASEQSVWSGNLPSASFSLTNASSSGTTNTKTNTTPSTTISSTPKSTNTTPAATPKSSTAQTLAKTTPKPLSYLTIIVTDRMGHPIKGAKVVMDNGKPMYTDSQGKAMLATETPGIHTVTITDPGMQPYQTKVTLATGQSIPLELQLTSISSNSWLYATIGMIGAFILAAVGWWFFRSKLPWSHKVPAPAIFTTPTTATTGVTIPTTTSVSAPLVQQPDTTPPPPEVRQNRSYYLRRRDGFDGVRGRR